MLGPGIAAQIMKMLRDDGLTPEQIAESLGLDPGIVAMCIQERSKNAVEKSRAKSLLSAHLETAVATLAALAESAENEGVQAKAAMYICDMEADLRGPKRAPEATNSIGQINIYIQQAQKAYADQIKKATATSAVDVEAQAEILKLN